MKGITKLLRGLEMGEQVEVTDMTRANLYLLARRIGIKVRVEQWAKGFLVTRVPTIVDTSHLRAAIPPQSDRQSKLANLREVIASIESGQSIRNEPVVEDWQFKSKEQPQFGEDGNVYRRQYLAPLFKRTRTVQVDEYDLKTILVVTNRP